MAVTVFMLIMMVAAGFPAFVIAYSVLIRSGGSLSGASRLVLVTRIVALLGPET